MNKFTRVSQEEIIPTQLTDYIGDVNTFQRAIKTLLRNAMHQVDQNNLESTEVLIKKILSLLETIKRRQGV